MVQLYVLVVTAWQGECNLLFVDFNSKQCFVYSFKSGKELHEGNIVVSFWYCTPPDKNTYLLKNVNNALYGKSVRPSFSICFAYIFGRTSRHDSVQCNNLNVSLIIGIGVHVFKNPLHVYSSSSKIDLCNFSTDPCTCQLS